MLLITNREFPSIRLPGTLGPKWVVLPMLRFSKINIDVARNICPNQQFTDASSNHNISSRKYVILRNPMNENRQYTLEATTLV